MVADAYTWADRCESEGRIVDVDVSVAPLVALERTVLRAATAQDYEWTQNNPTALHAALRTQAIVDEELAVPVEALGSWLKVLCAEPGPCGIVTRDTCCEVVLLRDERPCAGGDTGVRVRPLEVAAETPRNAGTASETMAADGAIVCKLPVAALATFAWVPAADLVQADGTLAARAVALATAALRDWLAPPGEKGQRTLRVGELVPLDVSSQLLNAVELVESPYLRDSGATAAATRFFARVESLESAQGAPVKIARAVRGQTRAVTSSAGLARNVTRPPQDILRLRGYPPMQTSKILAPKASANRGRLALWTRVRQLLDFDGTDGPLSLLLHGAPQSGKTTMVRYLANEAGAEVLAADTVEAASHVDERTATADATGWCASLAQLAINLRPCVVLLKNVHVLDGMDQADALEALFSALDAAPGGSGVAVVATARDAAQLSPTIAQQFQFVEQMVAPTAAETAWVLKNCSASRLAASVQSEIPRLARELAGLQWGDVARVAAGGPRLLGLQRAAVAQRRALGDAVGAPTIPQVQWDDVGGLTDVKRMVDETLNAPEQVGQGRRGLLFYGPPGTGKTLVAKAIASEMGFQFLSVKGPELLNMYIGESEANMRRLFARARDARPCIVFFDEIDSVAPSRGQHGDSAGVMDRIVSQLLAELDGLPRDVFVIGATNRPDLVDDALLRPGRFDKLLYLGVPADAEARRLILAAVARRCPLDRKCRLDAVAAACPAHFTGADLYALCSGAQQRALCRLIDSLEEERSRVNTVREGRGEPEIGAREFCELGGSRPQLELREQDFIAALADVSPSISAEELARYEALRQRYERDQSTR